MSETLSHTVKENGGVAYRNILIAVDESKEAAKAFGVAVDLAKKYDAHLLIVSFLNTGSLAALKTFTSQIHNMRAEVADRVEIFKKIAQNKGVKSVSVFTGEDSPASAIIEKVIPQYHCDLIVCGATGTTKLDRFLIGIGSQSSYMARLAPCSVLIVR
ncbi:universal stress protein [Sporolactobacillus sp. CQH2019]|uniref:universal stress protein n=1 Tax=Sporolactobacillus sp. CQH2019 TaxID=3023512 RepID=UPI002367D9E4|nr:universal stress protein [Sporolactobacillus sp. CQH2019]MDD9149626.1 universal stress protein [Sporolactobacillus sp. CQH2019]